MTRAIELSPTVADGYQNRGHARYALKYWSAALADWERAIRLDARLEPALRPWITKAESKR